MNFNLTIWWIKDRRFFTHNGVLVIKTIYSSVVANREFKEIIRRLLQRKRRIKIEVCARLSAWRLLDVGHVVRNALSLAWHESFSRKGKE